MPSNTNGHWQSKEAIDTKQYFGFIYLVTNTTNGKRYVGKKQFRFKRGKKVKESDWKTYTSSSNKLNADIKTLGKKHFTFEILSQHLNKATLAYAETKYIVLNDCIYKKEWYNEYLHFRGKGKKK